MGKNATPRPRLAESTLAIPKKQKKERKKVMKTMKKVLLLLLAIICILPVFAGCKGKGNEGATTGNKEQLTVPPTSNNQPPEKEPYVLEIVDLQEDEFVMVSARGACYQFEEYTSNTEIMNNAVSQRNDYVTNNFNCSLTMSWLSESGSAYGRAVMELMNNEMAAQSGEFDIVFTDYWFGLETHGFFCNLRSEELSPYIALDEDFWVQGINDTATIRNTLVGAVGYGSIDAMQAASVVFYNKNWFGNLFEYSIYDYVDSRSWTIENMLSMAKAADLDTNNNGSPDNEEGSEDKFGLSMTLHGARALFYGFGGKMFTMDQNGEPVLNYAAEQNVNAFNKLFDIYNETDRFFSYNEDRSLFSNERALFHMHTFSTASYLKNMDLNFEYGVLPLPLYNDQQADYITTNTGYRYFAIPTTVDSRSNNAIFINAFNYYSNIFTRPAFFDQVLKLQYSESEDDARMVDLIMDKMYVDFGFIYSANLGHHGNAYFDTLVMDGKKSYSAYYSGAKDSINLLLGDLLTNYSEQNFG